jgi:hypothetical protein
MKKFIFFRNAVDQISGTNIEVKSEQFVAVVEAKDFLKACKELDEMKVTWDRWDSLVSYMNEKVFFISN